MALPALIQGNRWTELTARNALRLLVWYAEARTIVTYQEIDRQIIKRGWGKHAMLPSYGSALGRLADALGETGQDWGIDVPPINALVVNKRKGTPGTGCNYYLEKFVAPEKRVDKMSDEERRAVVEETHEQVFLFERWREILEEYELEPIPDPPPRKGTSTTAKRQSKRNWTNEGESELHKRLKKFVAFHPEIVGLPKSAGLGVTEYIFESADRPDILFTHGRASMAVEVKARNAGDDDLNRGVFQCVKYQALLRAEQKVQMAIPSGRAVLVTERPLPRVIAERAAVLGIKVFHHRLPN